MRSALCQRNDYPPSGPAAFARLTEEMRVNLLLQMQTHVRDDLAPFPFFRTDFFHGHLVIVTEPESPAYTRLISKSSPLRVFELLPFCNQEFCGILVGIVASDEASPVRLNKHPGCRCCVVPDRS